MPSDILLPSPFQRGVRIGVSGHGTDPKDPRGWFISNEDLQAAIPGAPLAPTNGYFIIKNSWGPWWGDAGYAYLPWDYVFTQTYEAVSISGVQ